MTTTTKILTGLGIATFGAVCFFTLTNKGKELRKKWFGKKETGSSSAGTPVTEDSSPEKKQSMTQTEADALAGSVQVTGGRMTQQGAIELNKKIKDIESKLTAAGYKMEKVVTRPGWNTFKAVKV